MIIESNRLHQKIKRLKEELTRERELRKEAEKQLRLFKESACQRNHNQVLEMTEPTNIGLVVRSINEPNHLSTQPKLKEEGNAETSETSKKREDVKSSPKQVPNTEDNKLKDFLIHFSKMISDHNDLEIRKSYKDYKRTYSNCSWPTEPLEKMIGSENKPVLALLEELGQKKSWNNYQIILTDKNLIGLPDIWIWDVINEFVYQFQCQNLQSSNNQEPWNKNEIFGIFKNLLEDDKNFKFACLALIRLYAFFEDHQEFTKIALQFLNNLEKWKEGEVIIATYEIGFALMLSGKSLESVTLFLEILNSKGTPEEQKELSSIKKNAKRCIGFCMASNPKIRKTLSKNIISMVETSEIEEWKDGKVEAYWNFFSECSPYISRRTSSNWKSQNFKSIRFCLQRVTIWKPLRNLKGLLKVLEELPMETIPKSILPVTTESDIKFFCDNNNGLQRLVNSKSSAIERVLEDFPNIHRKETLTLLIMQYHKMLSKQKNEDKILGFGRKFVNVLKAIGYTGKINVEDAMRYIREVSKISMEQANRIVEDQCRS